MQPISHPCHYTIRVRKSSWVAGGSLYGPRFGRLHTLLDSGLDTLLDNILLGLVNLWTALSFGYGQDLQMVNGFAGVVGVFEDIWSSVILYFGSRAGGL